MKYNIRGQHILVTDALREHVEKKLSRLERYFEAPLTSEVNVTLSVTKNRQGVEVTIPLRGVMLRAEEKHDDMYAAVDLVVDKLERQIRLGVSQMDKLERFVERRREIAAAYDGAFGSMGGLVIPAQHADARSSWHLYVLRWRREAFKADRKVIFEALRAENIGVNVHYIPVYRQPYYRANGYADVRCDHAEKYYETSLSLPIFPKMTDEDIRDVIQAVTKIYQTYAVK